MNHRLSDIHQHGRRLTAVAELAEHVGNLSCESDDEDLADLVTAFVTRAGLFAPGLVFLLKGDYRQAIERLEETERRQEDLADLTEAD